MPDINSEFSLAPMKHLYLSFFLSTYYEYQSHRHDSKIGYTGMNMIVSALKKLLATP